MKKYLVGTFAILFAIGLCSFQQLESKASPYEVPLYWYPVQSDGTIDHTDLINPSSSTKLTKTQLRNSSLIPCPEEEGVDCIRGFNDLQTMDVSTQGIDFTQKQIQ